MNEETVRMNKNKVKTKTIKPTIHEANTNKLRRIEKIVKEHFGDMIKISMTDLVNIFIERIDEKLTKNHFNFIESKYLSEEDKCGFVLKKLKQAKQKGEHAMFLDLAKEIFGKTKNTRKKRVKSVENQALKSFGSTEKTVKNEIN